MTPHCHLMLLLALVWPYQGRLNTMAASPPKQVKITPWDHEQIFANTPAKAGKPSMKTGKHPKQHGKMNRPQHLLSTYWVGSAWTPWGHPKKRKQGNMNNDGQHFWVEKLPSKIQWIGSNTWGVQQNWPRGHLYWSKQVTPCSFSAHHKMVARSTSPFIDTSSGISKDHAARNLGLPKASASSRSRSNIWRIASLPLWVLGEHLGGETCRWTISFDG